MYDEQSIKTRLEIESICLLACGDGSYFRLSSKIFTRFSRLTKTLLFNQYCSQENRQNNELLLFTSFMRENT